MATARKGTHVEVVRVYGDPGRSPGEHRVLVDRLWPRGLTKAAVEYDEWAKDVAPSTELRRWYGHEPSRFEEFATRYRAELTEEPAAPVVDRLRSEARNHRLVLLTATRDVERSGAEVLEGVLLATGRDNTSKPNNPTKPAKATRASSAGTDAGHTEGTSTQ